MEKVKRWLWRTELQLRFFFRRLIKEVRLEYEARKYRPNDKMAREHYKKWKRSCKKFSELAPEEQDRWYEEERLKWKHYYDDLL